MKSMKCSHPLTSVYKLLMALPYFSSKHIYIWAYDCAELHASPAMFISTVQNNGLATAEYCCLLEHIDVVMQIINKGKFLV